MWAGEFKHEVLSVKPGPGSAYQVRVASVIWELSFEQFGARGIYNGAICSKICNLRKLSDRLRYWSDQHLSHSGSITMYH